MATNKIIKFADNANITNTFTDEQLNEAIKLAELKNGIEYGSIAYSDILNAILRQTTAITSIIGDLISQEANTNVSSSVTLEQLTTALENLSLATQTVKRMNSSSVLNIWTGKASDLPANPDPNTLYFLTEN